MDVVYVPKEALANSRMTGTRSVFENATHSPVCLRNLWVSSFQNLEVMELSNVAKAATKRLWRSGKG